MLTLTLALAHSISSAADFVLIDSASNTTSYWLAGKIFTVRRL